MIYLSASASLYTFEVIRATCHCKFVEETFEAQEECLIMSDTTHIGTVTYLNLVGASVWNMCLHIDVGAVRVARRETVEAVHVLLI